METITSSPVTSSMIISSDIFFSLFMKLSGDLFPFEFRKLIEVVFDVGFPCFP